MQFLKGGTLLYQEFPWQIHSKVPLVPLKDFNSKKSVKGFYTHHFKSSSPHLILGHSYLNVIFCSFRYIIFDIVSMNNLLLIPSLPPVDALISLPDGIFDTSTASSWYIFEHFPKNAEK